MTFISLGCVIALMLQVWFNTSAIIEYINLIPVLAKINIFKNYNTILIDNPAEEFPTYLINYYPSFISKLLHCPICLSVWSGIFFCTIFGYLTSFGAAFLGLFLHSLLNKIRTNA